MIEEGVFAADEVAEPAEEQRAERTHRKTGGEGEQREDESRGRSDAGEELRRQNRGERSVDIEVVPLENCAERRGEDHKLFFARHSSRPRTSLTVIVVMGVRPLLCFLGRPHAA